MDPGSDVRLPPKRSAEYPIHSESILLKKPASGVKKVAEIVLFLSAMAEMRAGRNPTQAELDLMADARAKLVDLCESTLAPNDLVTREAVGALIDDLGLNNKLKEQKMGFRPSNLSISDKLLQTKKKMEEDTKKFNARSAISGSSAGALSNGHLPGSTSASSIYPLSSNDGKPHLLSGVLNHTGTSSSFSLHRADKHPYGRPSDVSAGSSFDHGQMNITTWSVQPQTLSFSRHGLEHMVSVNSRSEEALSRMTPQATRDQPPRAFGQGLQLVNNHIEIAKTVHKLLQKQFPERPTWTPSSRDYMNKAVMCQVCRFSVNDVESVFLCDACEHAYHFRCLPSSNQKVVPRGEWHCPKCLQLSNGKPFPPKYGRVTRNVTASKLPSKVTGFPTSSEQKANMQKARTVDPHALITGS